MKISYLTADVGNNKGPRYVLTPESHDEQKFLTILRDALRTVPGSRLRMTGSEDSDSKKLNMPAHPALAVELCLEASDGSIPPEFIPSAVDKLDVDREIGRQELSRSTAIVASKGSTKIIKQPNRDGDNGSTVFSE